METIEQNIEKQDLNNFNEISEKICDEIIILEHVVDLDLSEYEVLKQKKYGDKFITFINASC